jgi:hypothetical protein
MVTTPKPRPRPREHNDGTCLCPKCKAGRAWLRKLGHYAPEPYWPKKEHPDLERELRELF